MPDDISAAIARTDGRFTRLEKRIAAYLQGRPEAVLVETSAEIAEKLDVSPMTVTRFFKKLGFENSAAAKAQTKHQLYGPAASRIGHRFENFSATRNQDDADADLEVATGAIRQALELRATALWKEIVDRVATADSVHAIGFQTMRYLADGLCLRLGYIRANVHLLDGSDGVYARLLTDPAPRRVLIIIDTFRYAAHGPVLARAARQRGIDVIVLCDEFCEWAPAITPWVLVFSAESRFFVGMPTGIHFALNLLVQDLIAGLGDKARAQIELLSGAQELFGQFLR
ncbi:MAG: MurR/RpiR family transcriptional regulator [Azospirillaceae bacterium]|nr:MurR/RpiR family transcriptional regulator [Azospirillaceae bacterium]